MPNRRPFDHIGAFNFLLEIEGVTQGPVIHVSGLTARTDVVSYKDGSDIIVRHRPGRSRSDNIVVRRGYNNTEDFFDWYDKVRDGKIERRSGSVIITGDDASEKEDPSRLIRQKLRREIEGEDKTGSAYEQPEELAPEGEQQLRVVGLLLHPAFRHHQLTRRIGALGEPPVRQGG